MLTHGWKQYTKQFNAGPISEDDTYTTFITGKIVTGLVTKKPVNNTMITLTSLQPFYNDEVKTDPDGYFSFSLPDLPEHTQYIIQSKTQKHPSTVLTLDEQTFPTVVTQAYNPGNRYYAPSANESFISKATRKQSMEKIMKTIHLEGVEVVADKIEVKGRSIYSSPFNLKVSANKIETMGTRNIYVVLAAQPGVMVYNNLIAIRGLPKEGNQPLILVDDMPYDPKLLDEIPINDIQQIEIVKGANAAIFGRDGGNGAILITTKTGKDIAYESLEKSYITTITPLGYQVKKRILLAAL